MLRLRGAAGRWSQTNTWGGGGVWGEETEAGLTGNDTRDMNRNSQQMAGAAAVHRAPV